MLTEYLRQPSIRVRAVRRRFERARRSRARRCACDLFVLADPVHLDRLAAAKLIEIRTRRLVATNSLAAIGPSETSLTVAGPRDLLLSDVKLIALADPASPLGKCSQAYLDRFLESMRRCSPKS